MGPVKQCPCNTKPLFLAAVAGGKIAVVTVSSTLIISCLFSSFFLEQMRHDGEQPMRSRGGAFQSLAAGGAMKLAVVAAMENVFYASILLLGVFFSGRNF